MTKTFFSLAAAILTFISASAKTAEVSGSDTVAVKPPLDHSVYDKWKSFSRVEIPFNGDVLVYEVKEQEGDRSLVYNNLRYGNEITVERGIHLSMNRDCSMALVKIVPSFAQTRQAKIDKKTGDKAPKDTIVVVDLRTGEIRRIENAKSAKYAECLGDYIAVRLAESPKKEAADTTGTGEKDKDKKEKKKKDDSWKNCLCIFDLKKFCVTDTVKNVDASYLDRNSRTLVFKTKAEKKDSTQGIFIYNMAKGTTDTLLIVNKKAYLGSPSSDSKENYITFLANADTAKGSEKRPDLYIYDGKSTRILLSGKDSRIPEGMSLKQRTEIGFSKDSTRYYFSLKPIPPEKDTVTPDFEKAKVAIWTWNEEYLRSKQDFMKTTEKNRSYLSWISLDGTGDIVRLEDPQLESVNIGSGNVQKYVLAATDKPYRIRQQWDTETLYDVYRVNLDDGSRQKIMEAAKIRRPGSSPDGRWYTWYDYSDASWYLYDIVRDEKRNLTAGLEGIFTDDEDDHPCLPDPYGSPLWQKDSKAFFIPDKYDVWQFDPSGKRRPARITDGAASCTTWRIHNRIWNRKGLEPEDYLYVDPARPMYFVLFDHKSKQNGLAVRESGKNTVLSTGEYTFDDIVISTTAYGGKMASRCPAIAVTKGNFESGYNLFVTRDGFKTEKQVSDINPQQRDYNWGTVSLVSWTANDGTVAEGLLFKPEDFDPEKKYPVMVYFYEKYSDDLYAPRNPVPSRSIINIPYFVSNGYIVFVPDIRYTVGHPGKSAMDYIMPGCDMLCEYPWIDSSRMGIQGQSWGGYQVAYMITQTGRFAAAGAGAPVSNMTSAYGGIRWGSGIVRQMQYEQGQSRIGKDLWEGFDLYIENSPLFFVPNITTPVLIMHNDKDDAVPWWQGIEFFTALRRCGKQAWMLQYIGEKHNLSQRKNAKDLSVRLSDFFDHFLKGAPMPAWMEFGVQAWSPEAE